MAKSKFMILPSLLAMMLALQACKKYEEGPWLSFRRAECRVQNTWEIAAFYVNGADSLADFKARCAKYCDEYRFGLNRGDGTITTNGCYNILAVLLRGGWTLNKNNKEIGISVGPNGPPGPWYDSTLYVADYGPAFQGWGGVGYWIIIRLKDDEMWLEKEYNGKVYEIRFKEK